MTITGLDTSRGHNGLTEVILDWQRSYWTDRGHIGLSELTGAKSTFPFWPTIQISYSYCTSWNTLLHERLAFTWVQAKLWNLHIVIANVFTSFIGCREKCPVESLCCAAKKKFRDCRNNKKISLKRNLSHFIGLKKKLTE